MTSQRPVVSRRSLSITVTQGEVATYDEKQEVFHTLYNTHADDTLYATHEHDTLYNTHEHDAKEELKEDEKLLQVKETDECLKYNQRKPGHEDQFYLDTSRHILDNEYHQTGNVVTANQRPEKSDQSKTSRLGFLRDPRFLVFNLNVGFGLGSNFCFYILLLDFVR